MTTSVLKTLTANHFNVPAVCLEARGRYKHQVTPKHAYRYLLWMYGKMRVTEIARRQNVNHTTIINSISKVNDYLRLGIGKDFREINSLIEKVEKL